MKPLKILVKFPSRERPARFFESLNSVYNNASDMENIYVLGTFDNNDLNGMNSDYVKERLEKYQNFKGVYGFSESKIHAVNRDMSLLDREWPEAADWDIVCVMSDDFFFTAMNWDEILRAEVSMNGLDVLIHLPDQDAKSALATMYIAGRKYYNRFGFIYHPDYKSLFCDNEVMEVAKTLGCYRYVDYPGVIWHGNPAYGHMPKDELFILQQGIGYTTDERTYRRRKAKNFDIHLWK